MTCWHFTR